MTWFGNNVGIKDGPNLDAFSRLRTSHPTSIFAALTTYDADPLLFEAGVTGTGVTPAHSADTRMTALSCTAGNGTCFLQSHEYIPYQPGKSQLAFITGLLGAAVAGAVVDVGLFDAANGLIFRQNGTTGLELVRRTSTSGSIVNNTVSQANWNLDPLNGSGPSGKTLDATKVYILVIDAQFLAMGRVRMGFDIDGQIIYCHEFLNANVLAVPYMQTLTLPVQMLLTTTGTAGTKTSYFKCASVSSEGGFAEDLGYTFSTPEQTVTAASGTRTHLLSLRPATTFNSITNRSRIQLDDIEIIVTGSNPVFWELCVGSTFSAAPTYAAVNATYSGTEYSSAVGTLTDAGIVVDSGYVSATATNRAALTAKVSHRYPLTLDRAGAVRANGTISLIVTGLGGTSATRAAFNFTEIR